MTINFHAGYQGDKRRQRQVPGYGGNGVAARSVLVISQMRAPAVRTLLALFTGLLYTLCIAGVLLRRPGAAFLGLAV